MKIRLGISLVVAIIAVVGLLYLQYVWIQKLYLIEQNRIRITALSVLDVVMADELVTSSLEWQKRYFDRGKTLPPAAEQAREGRRIQNHAGQSNAR